MSNSGPRWRPVPPRQMDYPDFLQAIREELSPVQGKLDELTKQVNQLAQAAVTRLDLAEVRNEISTQMTRVETRYYSKELVDAKLGLQETTIRSLREDIEGLNGQMRELAQRPTRVLNNWVALTAVCGGAVGVLSFLIQHLGLGLH